ncbi:methyltransferase domain-containing protein [Pedobacter sp. HMF7647]|uniref:Methyltransferase domain-containing protein n=1 Tax=Hufsiella arboris TaxID=2695275 RepID=A0A7K1YDI6_9SPHI|nr:class I SAM-dependent methyltransferase [Hufsiella arboris]MXV52642.1 methyltransferase domain-containing protein [Hufsiella arboris]
MIRSLCVFVIYCQAACGQIPEKQQNFKDSVYQYNTPGSGGTGKFYMGREIARFMDASGAAWLERNNRNQEENTSKAISSLPITKNSVIADIGAGSGYYTFRIAKKVQQGKVYAVEIQDEFIRMLNDNKKAGNFRNVEVIKGSPFSPNLPENTIDLAIMVDVYHEVEYPHELLQALSKALKPTGKLLLLEYRAEDPDVAIKELHKMSVGQLNKEMIANGYRLYDRKEFLPMQHFLVYEKTR